MSDALRTAWKRFVPPRQQRRVLDLRVAVRRRLDPVRTLPSALVIGGQRCGTSSLYKYLEQHPDVVASLRKETEYFTLRYGNGEQWYRAHFPPRARVAYHRRRRGRPLVTFEATPYYLFHPHAPARAAALLPDARLVVLLRDPVERAWSHYHHERRGGREELSFEEAVDREEERLAPELARMAEDPAYVSRPHQRHSYLARGRYAEQLRRWLSCYDRRQLLVLRSDDLYADPATTYAQVLGFLGLSSVQPAEFRNWSYLGPPPEGSAMPEELRARLADHFRPHNAELARLIGRDMGWEP